MELDGNNSDDDSIQLMSVDEIATYEFLQDKLKSTVDRAEESTRLSVVPKKVLDELFLNMDDLEPKRWWNPHGMFQGYGDPNTAEYQEHTMLIAAGRWKQMGFSKRDLMRFKLRYANKWSGADTFYDAWLINEGLRRTEFDYNLFIERKQGVKLTKQKGLSQESMLRSLPKDLVTQIPLSVLVLGQ